MARYKGKHRKPSSLTRHAARFALAGAVVGAPVALAAPANAADASNPNWDVLAECESSGNWSANTGNGFYGGLQFTSSTWKAFGGGEYASSAHQASREEQIEIAEKVLDAQGTGAWPGCSGKTNWESAGGTSDKEVKKETKKASSKPKQQAPKKTQTKPVSNQQTTNGADYTVQAGDTLSAIAQKFGVNFQDVAQKSNIADPNLILPGQQLDVK